MTHMTAHLNLVSVAQEFAMMWPAHTVHRKHFLNSAAFWSKNFLSRIGLFYSGEPTSCTHFVPAMFKDYS